MDEKANAEAIRKRGHSDGKAAGTWVLPDNCPDPLAFLNRVIQGIEDGDPEIIDQLPDPDFSGQWADLPSWEEIVRDETDIEELSDDGEHDLYSIYCDAFRVGVEEEIRIQQSNFS